MLRNRQGTGSRRRGRAALTTAVTAIALAATGLVAAPASAVEPTPGTSEVADDVPFHYARGDHLRPPSEVPTRTKYGYGRPVFLVGDSMAGQLADPLLAVVKSQHRGLLPRTYSATQLSLPGANTRVGRWSNRVFAQIRAERDRRPIVVLAGQYTSTTTLRKTVWQLRAKAGAKVLLVTGTPSSDRATSGCVADALRTGRQPNWVCRWRVASPGPGRWVTLEVAKAANVPVLDLLRYVARGTGTHPPVVRDALVHRQGSHVTATFARRVLASPLKASIEWMD